MELTKAYKFRIYPDAKRQSEIELQLTLSKEFYNLLLEKSIKSYKEGNNKLSMQILNRMEAVLEELRIDKIHPLQDAVIAWRKGSPCHLWVGGCHTLLLYNL